MMKKLVLICLLMAAVSCAGQTNLYVDGSVVASGNGTTWTNAYKTLGEALTIANNSSFSIKFTIRIAQGTYYPPGAQTSANQNATFAITRYNVALLGSYGTGGTPVSAIHPTTLSGNIGSLTSNTDNSYQVMTIAGAVPFGNADSLLIQDLNFTAGNAVGVGSHVVNNQTIANGAGAGINVVGVPSGVLVKNCKFSNFISYQGGSAIFAQTADLLIDACSFTNNSTSSNGGALYASSNGSLYVLNSTFSNNVTLSGQGGAIYTEGGGTGSTSSSIYADGCNFTNNHATRGGGIASIGGYLSLHACTFTNNLATNASLVAYGGAIFACDGCAGGGASNIDSCYFAANSSDNAGGAMYGTGTSYSFIKRCTFSGNKTGGSGGGLFADSYQVDSCQFSYNSAGSGGGLFYGGGYLKNVTYCNFLNDTANTGGGLLIRQVAYSRIAPSPGILEVLEGACTIILVLPALFHVVPSPKIQPRKEVVYTMRAIITMEVPRSIILYSAVIWQPSQGVEYTTTVHPALSESKTAPLPEIEPAFLPMAFAMSIHHRLSSIQLYGMGQAVA